MGMEYLKLKRAKHIRENLEMKRNVDMENKRMRKVSVIKEILKII